MEQQREAGVLCHISSLPGKYGIGSLGKEARAFARYLRNAGVTYWQVLPMVQTGYGDSPYSSVSCNSGNPYFIDLDELAEEGLLTKEELRAAVYKKGPVDYGALYVERYQTLRTAFSRFAFDGEPFRAFIKSGVAEDYALFMTAKTVYGGSFPDWDEPLKRHEPEALEALRTQYHEEYLFWNFLQFYFNKQWTAFKQYCNQMGLKLIGDLPLYVAYDSADVWADPGLFKLDEDLCPTKVAGVPPDYFSENGQLWGNPVYDWDAHAKQDFRWWRARLAAALERYDLVRLDHFRGIDRYYEIPYGAETAKEGEWVDGPKEKLFAGFMGSEKIIAEDLGIIDAGVRRLRKTTGFPGMKVLLFAFNGDPDNEFLPKNITEDTVCYTGTHDNDTVQGFVDSLATEEFILFRSRVALALKEQGILMDLGKDGENIAEALIRLAMQSPAKIAIVPIQDLMGLGNEARMNTPGTQGGNWQFRLDKQPTHADFTKLKRILIKYRR